MVIDIDSFLEGYEKTKNTNSKLKPKADNLDFQKDVEDRIANVIKDAGKEDFKALLHIYSELKKFDEDLPKKLLGIKKTSGSALKNIGDRYSDEFLKNITSNMQNLSKNIRDKIFQIDNAISSGNFTQAISLYTEVLKIFRAFPKEFTKEKIELNFEIRRREIMLNEKLESIKEVEIKRIKETIKKEVEELKSEIKKDNITVIEDKVEKINYIIDKVPKIFFVELIQERIYVAKTLMKVEKYLEEQYIEKFEEKKEIVYKLFDDFHKYFVNKDVSNALTTYDEILIEFDKIPEIFIDKKIEIYKQIGNIFDSINNLLLTSNVNLFLESYNSSKIILEARDYVEHIKKTNRYDINILRDLADKLNKVPNTFKSQKDEILNDMKSLVKFNVQEKKENNLNHTQNENLNRNFQNKPQSQSTNENLKNKIDNSKLILENKNNSSNSNVNNGITSEINNYYERLKNTNEQKEISVLYKKITFYLEMLHIDNSEKKVIMDKVNNLLKSKNKK